MPPDEVRVSAAPILRGVLLGNKVSNGLPVGDRIFQEAIGLGAFVNPVSERSIHPLLNGSLKADFGSTGANFVGQSSTHAFPQNSLAVTPAYLALVWKREGK